MAASNRRVLFFAYYYPPANTSGVQRAVRWTKFLPCFGYDPVVICSSAEGALPGSHGVHHVPNSETEVSAGRAGRVCEFVQRRFLPYNDQLPWVPHALAAAEKALSQGPVSAIVSTAPPVASHIAAYFLARRHRLPWIADFRDPILGNPGRPRKWARPYDRLLEQTFFSTCKAAIATTDVIRKDWTKTHPGWSSKYHLIWNGFDGEEGLAPLPIEPRPYKVLTHAGVVYRLRQPLWLAASLDRLMTRGVLDPQTVRLSLIGLIEGAEDFLRDPAVRRLIERGCLSADGKVVSRAEASRKVATADYLLILDIANLANRGYAVPAKIFDNILMGRPILAYTPSSSPVRDILGSCGVPNRIVSPEDGPEEVDRKVAEIFRLGSDPVRPSDWFFRTFDGRSQVETLAGILDRVTGRQGAV